MQRICVIGCSGAGKSTLSKRLAEITGLPIVSLDKHYWQPGWVPTPTEQWHPLHDKLVARDRWIIDGNYSSSLARRVAAADMIVFMDYPRYRCLARVLKRTALNWGRTRSELADGCPEHLDWEFLRFIWNFPRRNRPGLIDALRQCDPDRIHVVRNERERAAFLAHIEAFVRETHNNPTSFTSTRTGAEGSL